ncbi:formyltransferase family protein [Actinocrispum wychmicini]|uniref:phosphoribosylglycinamide formyltransferase 1 n=1 Tax=Actinocrispum wychmicini TaxID=1213861 RepID=A0A4R2IGC7_9PSEU|nr:formyltransferase family protein [Actinocrispum wychmicini]TCO43804.1 formyl transferase-like protein [Actinocrispum wychmicini]
MTAAPASEEARTRGPVAARHPVRVDIDGDFALDDLLALPEAGLARRLHAVPATLAALWRRHAADAEPTAGTRCGPVSTQATPTEADAVLLHRIEASSLFRPPVREQVADLSPEAGSAWLALAARWVDMSRSSGDLRFLNTACKLTGAVWLHHNRADGPWQEPDLTGQLAAVGRLLGEATDRLRRRLAARIVLAEPTGQPSDEALCPGRLMGTSRARIAVLASSGSGSAGRLVTAATAAGLPIQAVCWYTPLHTGRTELSNYSSAWYPPGPPAPSTWPSVPSSVPTTTAESWDDVTAAIRAADADVVLLVGMPVVPDRVLDAARLGVLNAHNGALPTHRGMDAVGWALLNNQPIVCSLHLARPSVDTGEVIAVHPVPISPTRTLAARVKTTQLRLLLAGAAHVATTGTLPDLTAQPAIGTQFYRLHPHLKRLLDASPYAHDEHPERMVTQP